MDIKWVLIRSWHAIAARSDKTLCGRQFIAGAVSDTLPATKSCESCLRIVARLQDA